MVIERQDMKPSTYMLLLATIWYAPLAPKWLQFLAAAMFLVFSIFAYFKGD